MLEKNHDLARTEPGICGIWMQDVNPSAETTELRKYGGTCSKDSLLLTVKLPRTHLTS